MIADKATVSFRNFPSTETTDQFTDLTVFIWSKNRPHFLQRQVQWWVDTKATILVGDGSEHPNTNVLRVQRLRKNLHYLHEPDFSRRCAWAALNINTPFSLIASDDDIYLQETVAECIDLLKHNKDVGSCIGQCLAFVRRRSGLRFYEAYPGLIDFEISSPKPLERLKAKSENYEISSVYAVQRTQVAKVALGLLGAMGEPDSPPNFISNYLYEITFEMVSALLACCKSVPGVMWLKSGENTPVRTLEFPDHLNFYEWFRDEKNQKRIDKWINLLSQDAAIANLFEDTTQLISNFSEALRNVADSQKPLPITRTIRPSKFFARLANFRILQDLILWNKKRSGRDWQLSTWWERNLTQHQGGSLERNVNINGRHAKVSEFHAAITHVLND